MTDGELERLVRYCHPAKILGTTRLPGRLGDDALAALYGTAAGAYRELAETLRRDAVEAAEALRAELEPLPVAPGERVIALGDSHTDDLASWAEVLAALTGAKVVNAGLSGDTTTHALARVDLLPDADRAYVLLGTNDARRHGAAPILVSDAETRRNLRAIDAALRRRCRHVVWITPPPIDAARIAADPELVEAGVSWRLEEVARKAALVRIGRPGAVDLWPGFGAEHLAADGLHPSAAGQRLIVERLVAHSRRLPGS